MTAGPSKPAGGTGSGSGGLTSAGATGFLRRPSVHPDSFARHGYVAIGKYLRADEQNLCFATLATRSEAAK